MSAGELRVQFCIGHTMPRMHASYHRMKVKEDLEE